MSGIETVFSANKITEIGTKQKINSQTLRCDSKIQIKQSFFRSPIASRTPYYIRTSLSAPTYVDLSPSANGGICCVLPTPLIRLRTFFASNFATKKNV